MFFSERIVSIKPSDKVLEIGPGASPYGRSNVFLELKFENEAVSVAQRGGVLDKPKLQGRDIFYYEGGHFPFKDKEFDYVICSHVIEHVEDVESFISEINRVSGGIGYLEYPLVTYEYLYNFPVHLNFIKKSEDGNCLRYMKKTNSSISEFSEINSIFVKTLESGWDDLCAANKELFFEGFEFKKPLNCEAVDSFSRLVPDIQLVRSKNLIRWFLSGALNKTNF